jgi:hypothetical protein
MYRLAFVVTCLMLATNSASASSPPKLDVVSTCHRAVPLLGDGDNSPYQSCMRDETDARSELTKSWGTFKPSAQRICTLETRIGGAPSYVELLTCLQLDQQAQEASRENHAAMSQLRGSVTIPGAAQSQ